MRNTKHRMPTILIASAGRRNYLVRWFREALQQLPGGGRLIVADADPTAPARTESPEFVQLPAIHSADYVTQLVSLCERHQVDLALSLNDFELSLWSTLRELDPISTIFVRLNSDAQAIVEDKWQLARTLPTHGVDVPQTITGLEYLNGTRLPNTEARVVVKDRYGSGSSGLLIINTSELDEGVASLVPGARNRHGMQITDTMLAADSIVIQELVEGVEYGLDIVNSLQGRFRAVLARQKLAMRSGETSKAITVSSEPYADLAQLVADSLKHIGSIDVDVITDNYGRNHLIDVNPRFGGGYPFNHLAGANIPLAIVEWLAGNEGAAHFQYSNDVTSAKFIDLVTIPGEL